MGNESRRRLVTCLCFLFLGVLIGISIDAKFRPNHIRFWVNPVQDLSLIFVPGDTIEWYQLSTGKRIGITFWGGSPCVGPTNPCLITNIPITATYYYTCLAPDGTNCSDPQGGPVSGTQLELHVSGTQPEVPGFFTKISDLIGHIFSRSPTPGSPEATQNMASTPPAGQAEIASAKATPAATYPTIRAQAYCASGVTHVIVPGYNADDPIHASVGQQILWGATATPLTISLSDSSTCSLFSSPAKDEYLCTVAKAGSYTATAGTCSQNTSESIAVP